MKSSCWLVVGVFLALAMVGDLRGAVVAKDGVAKMAVVVNGEGAPTELYAARELAKTLGEITGGKFEVVTNGKAPKRGIFVGYGAAARSAFSDFRTNGMGEEAFAIRTKGDRILLAGGSPRGTLYAASWFLQEGCGVRWWTPWATTIPKAATLKFEMNEDQKPAFEYREPEWHITEDGDWSWRNFCNGQSMGLSAEQGGSVTYKYFVHSSYELVPPQKYFREHPEWFAMVDGKRVDKDSQLCLSNPQLRDFVVERVKAALRESPEARIISVSQNDNMTPCVCADCAALDKAQGSQAGSMLSFVNYVAERIEPEFPNVAVDTLAYQYTRKPPATITARSNVIVRLCSIECNFREPLGSVSNAAFGDDIRGWEKKADRLYVWDYVTDFPHYIQPFPNWFELGDNLRFFAAHHVRGVFEEGAGQTFGAEMQELRSWVLARLMWNPRQDERALTREFLQGYYGAAAKPIEQYMELLHEASAGFNLSCWTDTDAAFLRFDTLAKAEKLWDEAEVEVKGDEELTARVKLGHLPVKYVWMTRWEPLREECAKAKATWPLATENRQDYAQRWLAEAVNGSPGRPWTKVTTVREDFQSPKDYVAELLKPDAAK